MEQVLLNNSVVNYQTSMDNSSFFLANESVFLVNQSARSVFVVNQSAPSVGTDLLTTSPGAAIPYILILGVIAVIGSFGNVMIVGTLTCGRGGWRESASMRYRRDGGNGGVYAAGNLFIINLACSDIIVTAIINPFAIVGK